MGNDIYFQVQKCLSVDLQNSTTTTTDYLTVKLEWYNRHSIYLLIFMIYNRV